VTNDDGSLAWGEAYVLQSYMTMYRATRDRRYLDLCAEVVELVLGLRDVDRAVSDYRGCSALAWSATRPYTAQWVDLTNSSLKPLVRLRCALSGAYQIRVQVLAREDGRFDLTVVAPNSVEDMHTALSLDAADPRYIVRWLDDRSPTRALLTAVDLREGRSAEILRTARVEMRPFRYVFAVHTGMIAAQLLDFRREVFRTVSLVKRYKGIADRSLTAAQEAVHSHDPDWRPGVAPSNLGSYVFARGAPVANDGTLLPHNHNLAMARALAYLFVQTGIAEYRDRVSAILQTFESDLSPGSAPIWPYYWSKSRPYTGYSKSDDISTFTRQQSANRALEDTSHGALDVEAVVACHRLGLTSNTSCVSRLATTFITRIARRSVLGTPVAAGAESASGARDLTVPRWIGLSLWNRAIYSFADDLYALRQPEPTRAEILAGIANLVYFR